MNGVYMTKAEKMMFGYNQDGDANGKSLKERDIYMSIMLKQLAVGSIQKDNKYFASSINLISSTILKRF